MTASNGAVNGTTTGTGSAGNSSGSGENGTGALGTADNGASATGGTGTNGGNGVGAGAGAGSGQGEGAGGSGQAGSEGAAGGATSDNTGSAEGAGNDDKTGTAEPVVYGDFKIPEGVTVNEGLLGEFKTTLGGLRLNQEQAQAIVDLGVKQTQAILATVTQEKQAASDLLSEAFNTAKEAVPANQFKRPDFLEAQVGAWEEVVKLDKELGGAKLEENLGAATRALESFGSAELKTVLAKSGFGSHPEVIRFFSKVGKLIGDDVLVAGSLNPTKSGQANLEQNQAQRLATSGIYDTVDR